MNADKAIASIPRNLKHRDITDKILHAFFKVVYPQMGYGFLEKVYENSLVIALVNLGLRVQPQAKISVYFQGLRGSTGRGSSHCRN